MLGDVGLKGELSSSFRDVSFYQLDIRLLTIRNLESRISWLCWHDSNGVDHSCLADERNYHIWSASRFEDRNEQIYTVLSVST